MAINDGKTFDPSKRIRDVLGEELVSNIEADALNRIVSQASYSGKSGGVKSSEQAPTGPVRNDFDASSYMERIVHSNGQHSDGEQQRPFAVTSASRHEALNKTVEEFKGIFMTKKSTGAEILMKTTGFNKSRSRAENITNAGCLISNIATGFVINHLADSYLRNKPENRNAKNIAGIGIVGSALDFASAYMFSGNKDTVEGLFDPNNITSAEATIINKAIAKEKVKYAAEHTAFGFVAPYVVSNVLTKVLPEKAKSNKVVQVATSFGLLSSVSKLALQGVRTMKDIKELKTLDGCSYTITEGQPCEAYEIVAKYAMRKSIDSQIDATIYGNIAGATINTVANVIRNNNLNKKSVSAVEVKPVVTKPKLEVKEPTKTEKSKNEKASA